MPAAPASDHVVDIVLVRPKDEVSWVAAGGIIAGVADDGAVIARSLRDATAREGIRDSMRAEETAEDFEAPVSRDA